MTERASRLAAAPAPQTAEDTAKLLEASLVLVKLDKAARYEQWLRSQPSFEADESVAKLNAEIAEAKRNEVQFLEAGHATRAAKDEAHRDMTALKARINAEQCPGCGSDTMLHDFLCELRPCTGCDEVPCCCGGER